jgi:hypothetical protein
MKRIKIWRLGILGGLVVVGLNSTGCQTPYGTPNNTGTDALAGGAVGAGAGALIGAAARNPVAGALIGGALGAGTGAAIGSNQDAAQNRAAANAAIAQAQAQQAQAQAARLGITDVIQLSKSGVDETNIINQIRTSGCNPLAPSDLATLQQNGVSPRVISEMQAAAVRPPTVVVAPGAAPPPGYVWDPAAGAYVIVRPYGYYRPRYYW